jgi:amino-acid N-acetyltransferase
MPPETISARPRLSAVMSLLASAGLPTDDLHEANLGHFFCAGSTDAPTGLVGLEVIGDVALLRSLTVTGDRRGLGTGTALVDHAEQFARNAGVRSLYLLTTTAEGFFAKLGYQRAERASAPAAIRATREFADICPASSAFMMRTL